MANSNDDILIKLRDDCYECQQEAADEIERLRKERDEARREVMSWIIDQACRSEDVEKEYEKRGWQYLREER